MPSAVRDGLETLLALGLLDALDGWDLLTWQESAAYPSNVVRPAYIGPADPPNAPDERVLVTPRTAIAERGRVVLVPVGIAWRGPVDGDPLAGLNYLAILERRLYRLPAMTLGTVPVAGCRRADAGPLPPDAERRPRAAATYLFRCRMATVST
jgi:hypothetical protein